MLRSATLPMLALIAATPALRAAEPVTLTVDPGQVVNRVDEKVYGHFLEHIYHSVNGGLWGELVWDRSFEGGGGGVAWKVEGYCLAQEGAASDVRLLFGDPGALNAVATRSADGRALHLKAVNPTEQAVAVKLVVGEAFPAGAASAEGQSVSFTLPPISAAVVTVGKR